MQAKIWFKQPAEKWTQALPVGNGRLGAMVFGGVAHERIQLNEDSVWSGGFRDRNNPAAKEALPKIRKLLREGKILEAEELTRYALTGTPEFQRTYQTLGDLFINFNIQGEASDYKRALCLDEAAAFTEFTAGGHKYTREVIASAPSDVIAIKLTTDNPAGLSFDARLVRNRFCENSGALGEDTVYVDGTSGGPDGITFKCLLTSKTTGGEMSAIGEYLIFRGVSEAELYITAATSFRFDDPLSFCKDLLRKARDKGYDKIRVNHVEDYRALENRVSLLLGDEKSHIPTDKRLALLQKGESDIGLAALYFRYGRYLLISCSRPGTLPANLQGIWCDDFISPWDSKFTININTEMNYWPAEICNLPECHLPLFEHLRRMHPRGAHTAQKMYGARGFVAHHNTDIWGDTAPQDTWVPASYWMMGAAWLCLHIWEHYQYTCDTEFLVSHIDLLKDACLFFADFLTENENGELVISPTISPENTYVLPGGKSGTLCVGCTMDGQILTELFDAFEKASDITGREKDFAKQVAVLRSKLPPTRIGNNGSIMEWPVEREEAEPGHRHMSHLFALYPGNGISPESTPELAAAARQTLKMRLMHGGGHTGWSRAWIINFYAQLGDANEAYFHLNELLRHSTLPNLFDDHPPFQIDGNFGATAAIARMLLQSTADTVYLLKALPEEWQQGEVTGLCAKGGLVASISWAEGKLTKVSFLANHEYKGSVIYEGKVKPLQLVKGDRMTLMGTEMTAGRSLS